MLYVCMRGVWAGVVETLIHNSHHPTSQPTQQFVLLVSLSMHLFALHIPL